MDSLFKRRQKLYEGGVPDQLAYGADLERGIRKRTRRNDRLALVSSLISSVNKSNVNKLQENLNRIENNLEDEKANLTAFGTQYTDHKARMKTLEDKGNGSLEQGMLLDILEKNGIKELSNLDGIKARYSDSLYAKLLDEAKRASDIMRKQEKEYSRLRTSFDSNNPEEGVAYDNLADKALFTKPVTLSLYEIGEKQKTLGNNNFLDSLRDRAGKNEFDLIKEGVAEEEKLRSLINATQAGRDAIEDYVTPAALIDSLLEEQSNLSKSEKSAQALNEELSNFVADTREFLSENNSAYNKGDYFFEQANSEVQAARQKRNYNSDYEQFKTKYGYTDEDIRRLYWESTTKVTEIKNEVIKNLIVGSDRMGGYAEEELANEFKSSVYGMFSQYDYDISRVPERERRRIVSVLNLKGYEDKQITESEYLFGSKQIEAAIKTLYSDDYKDLYESLPSKIAFNLTVLRDAKDYQSQYNLTPAQALEVSLNVQKFGLASNEDGYSVLGLRFGDDYSFQAQPFLPYQNGKPIQDILLNYDKNQTIPEGTFQEFFNTLNKNKVYWYSPRSLMRPDPKLHKDNSTIEIGQYTLKFNHQPDEEGNHFTIVN